MGSALNKAADSLEKYSAELERAASHFSMRTTLNLANKTILLYANFEDKKDSYTQNEIESIEESFEKANNAYFNFRSKSAVPSEIAQSWDKLNKTYKLYELHKKYLNIRINRTIEQVTFFDKPAKSVDKLKRLLCEINIVNTLSKKINEPRFSFSTNDVEKIKTEISLYEKRRHFLREELYPDGSKKLHANYYDDKANGNTKAWHKNGKLWLDINFKDNNFTDALVYDECGRLLIENKINSSNEGYMELYYKEKMCCKVSMLAKLKISIDILNEDGAGLYSFTLPTFRRRTIFFIVFCLRFLLIWFKSYYSKDFKEIRRTITEHIIPLLKEYIEFVDYVKKEVVS